MKKLLVLTILVGFFTGCSKYAESSMPVRDELTYPKNKNVLISSIQKATDKEGWKQYSPSEKCKCNLQTLYFKKRIKKSDLFRYRYQNRSKNKYTNLYVKIEYSQENIDVEFVDKLRMNVGMLGIDSKANEVLEELKDAIYLEIAAHSK